MGFIDLGLPPGQKYAGTARQSAGRWRTSNLVRWFEDAMKAIGGWAVRTTSAMTGKPRALIGWRDNSDTRWLAIGTESHLYALSVSETAPHDITPAGFTAGRADAVSGGGYGSGLYGVGTYGSPRIDVAAAQDASMWELDTFGQNLYGVMSDDGKVYKWTLNTAAVAVALGGTSPTSNSGLITSPEFFLFILGGGGVKRRVQWPDQQSDSTWTPLSTNQAGSYDLSTQGRIMCGRKLRASTLIFTDIDAHIATYLGLPYVYRFDRIGDNCGIISRGAVAATDTRAMWMSSTGFFIYDGVVSPVTCEVFEAVFSNLNFTQRSKITAFANSAFNEIWFLYPSMGSTENNSAVVYNLQENHWTMHSLARLSAIDRGIFANPIMANSTGYLYDHETGAAYDGVTPTATSGPLEIGKGDRLIKCREIIPDEATLGQVQVTVIGADSPTGAETTFGPFTPTSFTQARWAARQAKMKVDFLTPAGARWGNPRADIQEGGRR